MTTDPSRAIDLIRANLRELRAPTMHQFWPEMEAEAREFLCLLEQHITQQRHRIEKLELQLAHCGE